MNRKDTLVKGLRTAIDALKNDTINYNWNEQCSCNMGVVAQAILELSFDELEELHKSLFSPLIKVNKERKEDGKERIMPSWKNAVKYACPITGKNMPEIINILESKGMSRADIVHLEFLENPAILELSGIQKNETVTKVQTGTEEQRVASKNWFLKLFGYTDLVEFPVYKLEKSYHYPEDYYQRKENVILYLSAWLNILTNENLEIKVKDSADSHKEASINLEKELLHAVADEDYERAAGLRDSIAKNLILA
jgi:hypothetical protein